MSCAGHLITLSVSVCLSFHLFVISVLSADGQKDPELPHIKEEQEKLKMMKKCEDDEEKALSSPLHRRQTEENRETEPLACKSSQQMETENYGDDCERSEPTKSLHPDRHQPPNDDETLDSSEQADNSDDNGKQSREPQLDLNTVKLRPTHTDMSVSQPVSDDRTLGSDDWKETRKPQSDLKILTNSGLPEDEKECNTGKKSLSCAECGKTFDPKDCVLSYTKSSGEKPFLCSVCVQRSTQSAHLVIHKGTHSFEKTFRCSVCNKQFNYKGDALRHIRTHTGEKPFSCSVCGKRFTQSTGLGSHMRTHTGEKPFSCSVCPRQFIRSGILARHMRVHTGEKPYSCSVCYTSFSLSQSLLKHMRIHTGEKPFSCSVCDKKFTQKGHLTQHMTLHTGEKSFSCCVCDRKFTRQSRVKNHKCVTESNSSK